MTVLELKSYAKVNIGLRIMGRRADGYHDLDTYFHRIELHDDIRLSFELRDETSVSITGNEGYMPSTATDLMEKAARLFSTMTGIRFHADISITKRIPVQAGLGGGSSNASTVLTALDSICGGVLSRDDLMDASLALGSDVPFFTSGFAAAHGQGRGEVLEEIEAVDLPLVIVQRRGDVVSTREAFRMADEERRDRLPLSPWTTDAARWRNLYTNDFDPIQPILKDRDYLECASTALFHSTSGSGSSQLLVASGTEDAARLTAMLEASSGHLDVIGTSFSKFIH